MQGSGTGGRQGAAEGPGGQGGAAPAGGQYTSWFITLQTIFYLCIPKKDLAKPHLYFQHRIIMFCLEV